MFRVGHCPAYGAGLAYWALGEIIRGQFEIVDTDDSEAAWHEAQPRDRGGRSPRRSPTSRRSASRR